MGFSSAGKLDIRSRRLALVALLSLVLATGGVAPCAAARTYPGGDSSRGRVLSQENAVGKTSAAELPQAQGQERQGDSFRGADDSAGHADPVALHYARKLLTGRGSTNPPALQQVRDERGVGVGDTQSYKVDLHRLARRLGPFSKVKEDAAGGTGRPRRQNQNVHTSAENTQLMEGWRHWGGRKLQEKVPGIVGQEMEVQQPVVPAGPKEEHLFFAWSVLIGLGVASALVFLVLFCQHCVCSKRRKAAVVPLDGEEIADATVAEEAREAEDEGRGNSNVMPELQEHEIPQGALYGLFS